MAMSMEDRDGLIWLDGALVPWRDARVHILSYSLQHGAGVFEGVRCYDGHGGPALFRLGDHTQRFLQSAKMLGMDMPFHQTELEQAQLAVVRANELADCYLRPIAFLDGQAVGVSARGNGVHVAIAAWPWPRYMRDDAQDTGIKVQTSSFRRYSPDAALLKGKITGHYVNAMLAIELARRAGYDDALMLDANGQVAECTTSNVFVVYGGKLLTPPPTHILEGITRDTVLSLVARDGDQVIEQLIGRDELYRADEVFVTGTAAEIVPVVEVDGRSVGNGRPGERTLRIIELYRAAVTGTLPDAPAAWRRMIAAA